MKKIILGMALILSPVFASDINVEIKKIRNQDGKVLVALYNKDDENFANMLKHYKNVSLRVKNEKVMYTFKNIQDGIYAIAVIHDENENATLDTNFLGIPIEGYGFSNNIRPIFRAANFKESKFNLTSDINVSISLGY